MWQWLNSEMEVLIREGFIYVPLPFDAQIEAEVGNMTGEGAATGPGAAGELAKVIGQDRCTLFY